MNADKSLVSQHSGKAVRTVDLAFEKQLLNYLRATDIEVGLLLRFAQRTAARQVGFGVENPNLKQRH
jgi:hypothetical protein